MDAVDRLADVIDRQYFCGYIVPNNDTRKPLCLREFETKKGKIHYCPHKPEDVRFGKIEKCDSFYPTPIVQGVPLTINDRPVSQPQPNYSTA